MDESGRAGDNQSQFLPAHPVLGLRKDRHWGGMWAGTIVPRHCWWEACVLLPATAWSPFQLLSLLSHTCPSTTENTWDCVSGTKNAFPSFSGVSSRVHLRAQPVSEIRFPNTQDFPCGSREREICGFCEHLLSGIMRKQPVTFLLFWDEEVGGCAADQWVSQWAQALNNVYRWRTREVEPHLKKCFWSFWSNLAIK